MSQKQSGRPIVAANWKLNKNPVETREFAAAFLQEVSDEEQKHFMIFPPAINLVTLGKSLTDSSVGWGAQNIYSQASGAFTGESSAQTVKDIGAGYVLVGHSERRSIFNEGDDELASKVALAQQVDLIPMLCVGETLQQREAGETDEVICGQLQLGLSKADFNKPLMLAYEPVWAIGTGKVATPEQAGLAHKTLRDKLSEIAGEGVSSSTAILYGGSVKPDSAKELFAQPEVDGFLVGGASLKVESFLGILRQS